MTKTATHPAFEQLTVDLIARENSLFAAASARGVDLTGLSALANLRDATGFLDFISEGIARGLAFDSPELVMTFQWAVMKIVEFNELLPKDARGDLDFECFQRFRAALPTTDAATSGLN